MPKGPEQYTPPEDEEKIREFNISQIELQNYLNTPKRELTETETQNLQTAVKITKQVRLDFPKTGSFEYKKSEDFEKALSEYYKEPVPEYRVIRRIIEQVNERRKRGILQGEFADFVTVVGHLREKEAQADQLYYIASFLKRARLDTQDPIKEIRDVLRGKKILVLGDDIGSLSELLRFYGAESYGLEYDDFKVLVAHSGLLAENREPQTQVIEGNIADLFIRDSELMPKLQALGPFDLIFSDFVFNQGSGIEEALEWAPNTKAESFQENCKELLTKNGAQLHLAVNVISSFPKDTLTNISERGTLFIPNTSK